MENNPTEERTSGACLHCNPCWPLYSSVVCGWLSGGTLYIHDHIEPELCLEQMDGRALPHGGLYPINYLSRYPVGQKP